MTQIVHMKTQVSTWPQATAPLCAPKKHWLVASYNWPSVTCKRCQRLKGKTALERFYSKVEKSDGCWRWTGSKTTAGYGHFYCDGRLHHAHRWIFEQANGKLPTKIFVCHRCNNKECVNPAHLYPGTNLQNTRDYIRDGLKAPNQYQSRDTCANGHKFDSSYRSSRMGGRPTRRCSICKAAANRRYKEKKAQQARGEGKDG